MNVLVAGGVALTLLHSNVLTSERTGAIQNAPPTLTLDEALKIAEANAFTVRSADSTVEKTRQQLSQVRSFLGPRLSLGASYTRFERAVTAQFGEPGSPPVVIQPIDQKQTSATLSLPIDITGVISRQLRAADAGLRASQFNRRAVANSIRLDVRSSYFAVLRTEGLVRVAEQALINARERRDSVEQLIAGGQLARVELVRLESLVQESIANLASARNGLTLQKQFLNFVLARPIETEFSTSNITDLGAIPEGEDGLVKAAWQTRPELTALAFTLRTQSAIRLAEEAGNLPSLSLAVTHSRNLDPAGLGAQSASTVGVLSLSFPVFDSGLTRARVKAARQDEVQTKILIEQTRLAISQEVRAALATLRTARARVDAAEAEVRFSEETFRLSRIRQEAGEGTPVEIVDAQTALTAARNNVISARYDFLTAYAQLQKAVGQDAIPSGENK